MNVYDQAHSLASAMKQSDEFKEFSRLRELAYQDNTNKELLDAYKKLQYKMQARLAGGESMDEEELKRMQQISALLQYNQDASAYLMAEFRFQSLLADIYKILADAAGINLDMLQG
ncbi:YlbF family regulator [Eubacteriales bacterium OttesenSCG-928-N13]|nr:YlbF family regulator [Eubacteriales bacterium OttesenSCG-928-N13]